MSKSDVLNPELPVTNIERVISAMVGRFGDRQFNDQQLAIKRQVLAQADQCVDDILARGSKNLSLMLYAANRAIEMGQMDRAIDITLRADQLMAENSGAGHPRVTFQLVQIARHLINTGESDSAETLIETLTTNRESVGWGSFLSGEMASQQGRDDEAILYFMQARSQLGDLPVIRLAMIDAYARAGRWEELLKLAESTRVIIDNSELVDSSESRWSGDQLGPAEPFILRQIQALLALDRWDDAIVHFSELQNTPVESRAIPLLAEWLWKHGQRDDAKRLMTDAIRKYSGDKPILSQDQSEAVILMLDEVKAEMPEMPNLESLQNTADQQPIVLDESNNRKLTTHRLLGDQAMKRYAETSDPGDASEAELHYRAVLKQSPRDAITGNNLAWLLANELGHPEEAVDLIETVIGDVPLELVPADIVHTLANAYRMNRQYEKSLAVIRTKLEQHPDHAAMWLELGQIQFDMRDFEQARAALDNAIRNGITGTKLETANGLLGKIRDTQP